MVVRPQRRRVLPHDADPRDHVLLPAEGGGRPVYSYRLSIVHFWALVFIYIWAGPHHLLYTALPDWAQTLGMLFSLMLWAPSWGGMLNGLLTLRGAWHKVRTDPVLKFFVAGVTFYGMATFEGPLLSIKSVNALGHYTDWIIGHVHSGRARLERPDGRRHVLLAGAEAVRHQAALAPAGRPHFWIATVGILLYVAAMWVSGIQSGLMWRAQTEPRERCSIRCGSRSSPRSSRSTSLRSVGGGLFILGWVLMIYNLYCTARSGKAGRWRGRGHGAGAGRNRWSVDGEAGLRLALHLTLAG